ncbi:kinase-like domain-containing protein [Ochromonadaceae sp. CCMP2298]|nr:kinase-like domain-containing protein [Ochromonadaceae sp. CCMP2298]
MRQLTGGLFPTLSLKDLALLHVVGGGGFGQVWKGTWGGTPVAVKLLSNLCQNTQLPEQLLCAFEEEVTMLAQLRHPNICLFLGVCLEPPNYAIVTELVSRGSLWDALRIPGLFQDLPWPTGVLRRVLEGTVRGLIYLHGHSPPIIHRDLKSANLLLDETFNVKICDFGLARLRDYNTVLTANVGTIHWMAPEVLTGTQYNESADIYSVGIVMWELFTGQCPYEHMKQVEVALSVVQRGLRPIIPNCCSAAQAAVIRKCWATDPAARFTAEQLLEEINVAFPVN